MFVFTIHPISILCSLFSILLKALSTSQRSYFSGKLKFLIHQSPTFVRMKRVLILGTIYGAIFVLGYFGIGLVLHYIKPEVKILPRFVGTMLDDDSKWEVKEPTIQDISKLNYKILGLTATDSSESILFTEEYGNKYGVFCFRGNPQRNNPVRGNLKQKPTSFRLDWVFETQRDDRVNETGSWGGGSGWTGQPLVIQWPQELKEKLFGATDDFIHQTNNKEAIVGSLCGNIYFIDWEKGIATRPHLTIENPIKGTVSVDPRMNGLLFVGQGIPNGERFGSYVFNMFSGQEVYFRNGLDPTARRPWGAFDSNALIDPITGTWFHPGENGQIYKAKINTNMTLSNPTKFNYYVEGKPGQGLEASMGAWNNLGFFGDNSGNVFCLDLMTMRPIWYFDNEDDTDASMVIDLLENDHPYLYIGNEVDIQGASGMAYVRKIDAITGKELWKVGRACAATALNGRINSGGVLASVLPGKEKAKNLVFAIYSRTNNSFAGELVALNKKTGKEEYVMKLPNYSWASPIALYTKKGDPYLFFTDVFGNVYLTDALTGKIIHQEHFPVVWESSPVAWNNRIVVGARGNKIFSFVIE